MRAKAPIFGAECRQVYDPSKVEGFLESCEEVLQDSDFAGDFRGFSWFSAATGEGGSRGGGGGNFLGVFLV